MIKTCQTIFDSILIFVPVFSVEGNLRRRGGVRFGPRDQAHLITVRFIIHTFSKKSKRFSQKFRKISREPPFHPFGGGLTPRLSLAAGRIVPSALPLPRPRRSRAKTDQGRPPHPGPPLRPTAASAPSALPFPVPSKRPSAKKGGGIGSVRSELSPHGQQGGDCGQR